MSKMRSHTYAVSELVGSMFLIVIAVLAFSVIYSYMFPLPQLSADTHVKLQGYVDPNGFVIIEHVGGESFSSYRIDVRDLDGALLDSQTYTDDEWEIGEYIIPTTVRLLSEENKIHITIYEIGRQSQDLVFDGILQGKTQEKSEETNSEIPLLISSLLTNTTDEDLVCFNKTAAGDPINATFPSTSYIYRWMLDGNPFACLMYPMNGDESLNVKDYSGNGFDGSIDGATWVSNGKIGGAYLFDGDDGIDGINYCFSASTIGEISVEAWIKTNESFGTIISYDREKYWDLGLYTGKIRWSTTTSLATVDTKSSIEVNDNEWHHIFATYDSTTGMSCIYIDGILDVTMASHGTGQSLGTGVSPLGQIGRGTTSLSEIIFSTDFETITEKNNWNEHNQTGEEEDSWETLTKDDFEGGWGNFESGGLDCTLYTGGTYAYQADNAVNIQSYGSDASFNYYDRIDVDSPGYTSITIDFWYRAEGIENGEYFRLFYFDGSYWQVLKTYVMGSDFETGEFYHELIWVNETEYTFPSNMDIGFRCYADYYNDNIYIDKIYVNATGTARAEYTFDLLNSDKIQPLSGDYSLGGYGDFDPEKIAFNRSSIDLTDYYNVSISFYYKYKNIEPDDFFAIYYLYNGSWVTLVEEATPSGEISWTNVYALIPDDLEYLILQFEWETSSEGEYLAIDDLEIRGHAIGNVNFSGIIDSVTVYERTLSAEQIYQNYLCSKDGKSSLSVIVSEETIIGQYWSCLVSPVHATEDAESIMSNGLTIINYGGG